MKAPYDLQNRSLVSFFTVDLTIKIWGASKRGYGVGYAGCSKARMGALRRPKSLFAFCSFSDGLTKNIPQ